MSYLTKYGTLYGLPVVQTGQVFYVAPAASYTIAGRSFDASNDNDGLSPERAIRDLNRFVTLATANVGDVAVLLEGTHTVTAVQRITKAGLTVVGVHDPYGPDDIRAVRPKSILTSTGTSTVLLSVEANNFNMDYVTLRPTTGFSTVQFRNASPNGTVFFRCYFDLQTPNPSVNTYGIDFGYRADSSDASGGSIAKASNTTTLATAYVRSCVFVAEGAQGRAMDIATAMVHVKDCWFHNTSGAWATPFSIATAADGCVVEKSVWITSGTMGVCIDGTLASVADGVHIIDCRFPRTGVITSGLVVDNFGSNEAQITESYQEGNATAVTTIT